VSLDSPDAKSASTDSPRADITPGPGDPIRVCRLLLALTCQMRLYQITHCHSNKE